MQIIVVDDHALIREALRGVLKELEDGATVLEAPNGGQALRLIEDYQRTMSTQKPVTRVRRVV